MAAEFIAATIPAKIDRVSGITLFHLAMLETGDPLQWPAIAELNLITDPWIVGLQAILIPPVLPTGTQSGILDPTYPITAAIVTNTSVPRLDFSQTVDSQYILIL
jgi:hypothetical protein